MTPTPTSDDLLDGPWLLTNAPTATGVHVRPVDHFVHAELQAWAVFIVADVRIPADREHPFRSNVNRDSARS